MLIKFSMDNTVGDSAAAHQAAVQADHFGVMQVHNLNRETPRFTMSHLGARAVAAEQDPPLKIVGPGTASEDGNFNHAPQRISRPDPFSADGGFFPTRGMVVLPPSDAAPPTQVSKDCVRADLGAADFKNTLSAERQQRTTTKESLCYTMRKH